MDELTRIFRTLIGGASDSAGSASFVVSEAVLNCARANKISVLLGRGVGLDDQNAEMRAALLQDRRVASLSNAHILHLIHVAHQALSEASIRHFFYKGPVQQKALYGDFFAKRSADADLMVLSSDFDRARTVLATIGFHLAPTCDGPWWRLFLGEQHLFHKEKGGRSLDLHHRFQQPGCPAPVHADRLFDHIVTVEIGGVGVPTMGTGGIALIAVMNLVKAIHHREPAGSYALDLLMALSQMSIEARKNLLQEAKSQQLGKSLIFAASASAIAFQVPDLLESDPVGFPVPQPLVQRMILAPHRLPPKTLKRSYLLFSLSDDPIFQFGGEAVRWGASEACRLIFQRDT